MAEVTLLNKRGSKQRPEGCRLCWVAPHSMADAQQTAHAGQAELCSVPVGWGEAAPLHGAHGCSQQRRRADGKHSSSGTSHGPAEALPRLQADLRGCSNHMTASVHRAPCTRSRACRKSSARQMSCSVSTRSSSSALFVSLAGPASHACSSSCVKAQALILRCVEHCLYVLYSSQDCFSGRLWHLRFDSCLQTYQSSAD